MATFRYQYGIDLGTTNSAIFALKDGMPKLIKIDGVDDIMPSCVAFTRKGQQRTGKAAYNTLRSERSRATKHWESGESNVFIEFKRNMGLDTVYHSSNTGRDYNAEQLSAMVLQALKSFVQDDNVSSAVITVPAKFKSDQIAATKRAADIAGIEHCELLQEPIAAAMAYGITGKEKEGNWLIFDFGGGTFDTALIRAEDGILRVIDTEGDNYLGGKNLDYALVDEIFLPYLEENYSLDDLLSNSSTKNILRDALKFYAEQAKNDLSFKTTTSIISQLDEFGEDDYGEVIEFDLEITREEVEEIFQPIFQKAIDICLKLLSRNALTGADIDQLVLVGGPTYSPVLRDMLREQITRNINTDVNPMTAVAYGAALYASTLTYTDEISADEVDSNAVILDVSYEANSVEDVEFVTCKIASDNPSDLDEINVELKRSDNSWSSGRMVINRMGELFECPLREHQVNSFNLLAYDAKGRQLKTIPDSVTIIHGTKVGSAVLPYNIGIEVHDVADDRDVFITMPGLEKNKNLPAIGVADKLKTPGIQAGSREDRLIIPIYQGEHNVDYSSAIYNDHVFDVVVSGDELRNSVEDNSEIKVTIKVDASQLMKVIVEFKGSGEKIEKPVDVQRRTAVDERKLREILDDADEMMKQIIDANVISAHEAQTLSADLEALRDRFDAEVSSEDGKMHLLADLRRLQLEIEKIQKGSRWQINKANFDDMLDNCRNMLNDEMLTKMMEMPKAEFLSNLDNIKERGYKAINSQDIRLYNSAREDVSVLVAKAFPHMMVIGFIMNMSENFDSLRWHDAAAARAILNKVLSEFDQMSMRDLYAHARRLNKLLDVPENQKARI